MADQTQDVKRTEPPLDELLASCIAAEEAGQPLDRQELLARHPQLAEELQEFFANRDQMQRLAAPLRGEQPSSNSQGGVPRRVRYFGDYELIEEIAAGGMGIVYKARQVSLNRIVAVKMILKGTLASEEDVKRFRAEAEAAANLQHPAIVAIHEVGLHEGQHYFSMDYVEGHSLAELPRQHPLSGRQAAEYVRDVAEAVHYAHQQGTLHRDLKPSNILIDHHGRVRITDFGLAKRIQGNSDLTLTGQILGTPSYMPPEQASGKRSLIGAASDIYSLGAVLYDLLAGRPPFRGESPGETLRQVESLDPLSPRLLNPTTPRDLETICLKCLEKEPHKRYGTAQLLADDIGRYLRGEPIVARPISLVARAWRWCRRKPVAASLVAVSIVAIIALSGAAVSVRYSDQLRIALTEATAQRSKAELLLHQVDAARNVEVNLRKDKEVLLADAIAAKSATEVARREADDNLYLYRIALANRELVAGNNAAAKDILGECPVLQRHWEWYYSDRKSRGETVSTRIEANAHEIYQVTFSPNGELLASAGRDGEVKLWSVKDNELVATLPGPGGSFFGVAFSPDGGLLAAAAGPTTWNAPAAGNILIWDVASRELSMTLKGHSKAAFSVAFDPTGQYLASASYDNTVRVWSTNDGEQLRVFTTEGAAWGMSSTFSPDGKLLAAGLREGPVAVWDAHTGAMLASTRVHEKPGSGKWGPFRVIFTPDSKSVLSSFQARENGIDVRDARTGSLMRTFGIRPARETRRPGFGSTHITYLYELAMSPDGRRLATAGGDGTVRIWDMSTYREVLALQHDDPLFTVAFSPDGRRIATGSGVHTGKTPGRITIWDAGIDQKQFDENQSAAR